MCIDSLTVRILFINKQKSRNLKNDITFILTEQETVFIKKEYEAGDAPSTSHDGEYQAPPQRQDVNKIFQDYLKRTKKIGQVEVVDGPFGQVIWEFFYENYS